MLTPQLLFMLNGIAVTAGLVRYLILMRMVLDSHQIIAVLDITRKMTNGAET